MTWVLCLNDMRSAQVENIRPVCRAETKERLVAYLESEAVPGGYQDGQWSKAFRAGGPLEWFNPPWDFEDSRHFQDAGTVEQWAADAAQRYVDQVLSIPELRP